MTGNVLAGAKLYVDPTAPAALAQASYAHSNPAWASLLGDIASEPGAHRFYMWNMTGNIAGQVAHYLQGTQLQDPGSTVMLSTYNLVHDSCGFTATPDMRTRYDNFMNQMAAGIGNFHVIFFLDLDSLITTPCLTPAQLAIREAELRYAVTALEADPHVVVYLDGGAADALPAARQAQLLRDSGVGQAQGFFLNSTHFDWTARELAYGAQISQRLGGAHFIINTGENGRGPLVPANRVKNGNEVLCNPPGRGLGAAERRPGRGPADRLRQRRRLPVVHQSRRQRRSVRPGCAAHRRVLARLRGDAGAELGQPRHRPDRTALDPGFGRIEAKQGTHAKRPSRKHRPPAGTPRAARHPRH